MSEKSRIHLRHILAIVAVVASVAVLYLILANLLFSRTYDMLTASMKARGESNVSRLAELVSWGLAARSNKEVEHTVKTFQQTNPETRAIVVLNAEGEVAAKVGPGSEELLALADDFGRSEKVSSHMEQGFLVAVAPSRSEFIDKPVGYVISSESAAGYLKYRETVFLIALFTSVLGLIIVGKLLHSQISVSIKNANLMDSLKEQAEDLRIANVELETEIEERNKVEAELAKYRLHLEDLVEERTTELNKTRNRLVEASRKAGMAEVATGVLHNVGNVLNSVNVGAGMIRGQVSGLRVSSLSRAVSLLEEHSDDLGSFVTEDPKGKMLPMYLKKLAEILEREQKAAVEKVDEMIQKIDQIKVIVSLQQNYAYAGGLTESCALEDVVEDAIQINMGGFERHRIELRRDYQEISEISVEKQKLVQILVNLLSNAKYAMKSAMDAERVVTVRTRLVDSGDKVEICVEDTGVGISRENLTRIFNYGFTTRKEGHGFGLHSSANAANEMGGRLSAYSEGEGTGAKFVLCLPLKQAQESADLGERYGRLR